jgi:hypothetical protein
MSAKTGWFAFWNWCADRNGWQTLAGIVYLIICVFDFVIVPAWIGLNRIDMQEVLTATSSAVSDPSVQMMLIENLTQQHTPFTLQAGGLFHLSFGAILTGSALSHKSS